MTAPHETFHGFVETTTDTLLVFEACRRGILTKINRRLQEKERGAVKPGTVYVFDERESGIKRWTDGYVWSPSRILGNFLIYRELEGRDGNRAMMPTMESSIKDPTEEDHDLKHQDQATMIDRSRERALVGSLTTSYNFKKGGLIKKTMSIIINGSPQHLISYYTKEDVLNHRLRTPSSIPELACLDISADLLHRQSFRIPPTRSITMHPHHHQEQQQQQQQLQHDYETSSMTVNRASPYYPMPFPSRLQRKRASAVLLSDYWSAPLGKQERTPSLDYMPSSYNYVNNMAPFQATTSPPQEDCHSPAYYRYDEPVVVQTSPSQFAMKHTLPIYTDITSPTYNYWQSCYSNAPPVSPPPQHQHQQQHQMAHSMYPIATAGTPGPTLSSPAVLEEEKAAMDAAAAYYSAPLSSSSASPPKPIVYPMAQKPFISHEDFYASPAVTVETTTTAAPTEIQYY